MIADGKAANTNASGVNGDSSGRLSPEAELVRRREARARRRAIRQEAAANTAATASTEAESDSPPERSASIGESAEAQSREARRQRPRAPRAERQAAQAAKQDATADADKTADSVSDALQLPDTLHIDSKGKSGSRIAARARKRQQAAVHAVDSTEDNPALGALNRHLNLLMQQLMTAHRVIGRVAAERDALRQQLADLQGIPVEEIIVSTIGASTEVSTRSASTAAPESESRLAKLNYFGGDDVQLMRKRRQTFVLILAVIGGILAVIGRQLGWSMPDDISRDSLGALPILGNLMTVFLAGWVLYRVVRVGSKGVRWVFPTEDRRRRRR